MRDLFRLAWCAALLGLACGAPVRGVAPDSGADSGEVIDAGEEFDAGLEEDAGVDAGEDAGFDAGDDAGVDGGDDAGFDAGSTPDASLNVYIGIIGTGQSLSVGVFGAAVSTTQTYGNLKVVDAGGVWTLAPLTEPIRPPPVGGTYEYPENIFGESPASGMSNEVSKLTIARGTPSAPIVHSVVGWTGHAMNFIDKDGGYVSYPSALAEARAAKALLADAGKSLVYRAVHLTHGESDQNNARYETELFELWQDYNRDLKAITGQSEDIVLIHSQQCSVGPVSGIAPSTKAQWSAGVTYPGKIVLAGPKYQYVYVDKVHLNGRGYRRMAIKYGEVFDAIVNKKEAWQPLQPLSVTRAGAVISVKFHVPNPPLTWDTTLLPSHQTAHTAWANGRGFEVQDSTGELTISSVAIAGDVVKVNLAQVPTGTGLVVRYAATADVTGGSGGQQDGRRGQLCDSDFLVGHDQKFIDVDMQNGLAVVDSPDGGTLAGWDVRDAVEGAGLPPGTLIVSKQSNARVTLSAPWFGASGPAKLSFHSDQRNYAVQFSLPVP